MLKNDNSQASLIDTHSHLYWDSFEKDLDEIVQRSIENGVSTIINVGVDVNLSKKAAEQTENKLNKISNFKAYSTIGIHPHEAIKYPNDVSIHNDIEELEKIYKQSFPSPNGERQTKLIIAIGECGLDYFFENNPYPTSLSINKQKELQIKLFQAQIDLAKKLDIPLLIHCRDDRSQNSENSEAWDKVLQMVGTHPTILHCYSGLLETTKKILSSPTLFVSFAGTLTYPKNEYLREAAKILPLQRIVLETDCPFLPPQSKRGQRNEPANIKEIAQLLADLKNIPFEEVAQQTTMNASKILAL